MSSQRCPSCQFANPPGTRFCGDCGTRLASNNGEAAPAETDGAAPALPFAVGSTVAGGRYVLEAVLGQGGMGTVYRARDVSLDRRCALKVLNAELTAHPTARKRMEREARSLARIEHPNVVQVRNIFLEHELLVMELEYMEGGDLAAQIGPNGMPPARVVEVMSGVLAGLQALHDAQLVHRDIKPENILLNSQGVPKLTDLGVARDESDAVRTRTRLGAVLGTLEYMSPEQIQGQAVDARSDVYSAGLLLHKMLAGRLPYAAQSDFEWQVAHVQQQPDLTTLRQQHPGLASVVERALNKDPAGRWPTAAAMARAVAWAASRTAPQQVATPLPEPVVEQPVTSAPGRTAAAPGPSAAADTMDAVARPPHSRPSQSSSRTVKEKKNGLGLGVVLLLMGLVALGALLIIREKPPNEDPMGTGSGPAAAPEAAPAAGPAGAARSALRWDVDIWEDDSSPTRHRATYDTAEFGGDAWSYAKLIVGGDAWSYAKLIDGEKVTHLPKMRGYCTGMLPDDPEFRKDPDNTPDIVAALKCYDSDYGAGIRVRRNGNDYLMEKWESGGELAE